MDRNGYFLVTTKGDGTYIQVFPKQGNGEDVTADNVATFLSAKNFTTYDILELKRQLMLVTEKKTFKVSDAVMNSSAAFCDYIISEDRITVKAIMYPAVGTGSDVTVEEVERDLRVKQIMFGIREGAIEELVNKKLYNTPVIVAQGELPVEGRDASIEYMFNTEHVATPKVMEDGTVDYHDLDLISHVEEGAVLARMNPEIKGTPGRDVFGTEIAPRHVKKINFKYGKNISISEDGLSLITKISGHVVLEGEKVFVSNTYEIPVDLDASTGDVTYEGDVVVKGNIRSGFSLKAAGNITVLGVVEGAYVEAGGSITINRGVQGMNKAEIKAGTLIVSKFIENATVSCDGNIEAGAIMHSNVSAKGNITVLGKNGLIVGGTIRAGKDVTVKMLGNDMGTVTNVYIGVDPTLKKKIHNLGESIKKNAEEKNKLNQLLTALRKKQEQEGRLEPAKQEMLQKTMRSLIILEQSLKQETAEYNEGKLLLTENVDVKVKITGTVYTGVRFTIGDITHYVKDNNFYCQFYKKGADVVCTPL